MTPHDHRQFVPGCFRCELGRDEALAADSEPLGHCVEHGEYWTDHCLRCDWTPVNDTDQSYGAPNLEQHLVNASKPKEKPHGS